MITKIECIRPLSLVNGREYLFRERYFDGEHRLDSTVIFINYTPCPAIVIIKLEDGSQQRCLRDEIYELRGSPPNQITGLAALLKLHHYAKLVTTHLALIFNNIKVALSYQANYFL